VSEPGVNHPPRELLRQFSLGQVNDVELADIGRHLSACQVCCGVLDQLAAEDAKDNLVSRLQTTVVRPSPSSADSALLRKMLDVMKGPAGGVSETEPRVHTLSSAAAQLPGRVAQYEILAEVGRGGMGVVYKARDTRLNRLVALKMVLSGEFASEAQRLRFHLEAELAARVQDAHIVRVYEIGSHDGRPYLVMEWVEGGTLADCLDGRPWTEKPAARLIETLARAIYAAHAQGVIHRDIKPRNILIEGSTKNLPPGADAPLPLPKIADFGLARAVEGNNGLTQSGFVAGTPEYMAPEQAAAQHALMGPATDVYALGVVLYELLTGSVPFTGKTPVELLRDVSTLEPRSPRRLQPLLSRDLEAIVLKCLEKEPARRYATGVALADDLRRFLDGRPIAAQPVSAVGRVKRWARRNPGVATLVSALALVLLAGFSLVTWKWLEADEQRDLAQVREQQALQQAYRGHVAAALAAIGNHDVTEAAYHLAAAPKNQRDWEWHHLFSRLDESSAGFLPKDGERLRVVAGPAAARVQSAAKNQVRVRNLLGEQEQVFSAPHPAVGARVTMSDGGTRVTVSSGKSTVVLNEKSQQLLTLPFDCDIVLSPDFTMAAVVVDTGGNPAEAKIYDIASGKLRAVCRGHGEYIYSMVFSPDSKQLATASEDGSARLWSARDGTELGILRGHAVKVLSVNFSPDGKRLATTSADGTVRQWDTATYGEFEPPYDRHRGDVLAAAYSPDGTWIASGGSDRTVRLWRAVGRKDGAVLHGHTATVEQLAFGADGQTVVSAAMDGSIRLWDVPPRGVLGVLAGHTGYVYPVAVSPNGEWIASGSWDNTVRLWDAKTGQACAVLRHPSRVLDLAFSPDGSLLATGCGDDDLLRFWKVSTGEMHKQFKGPGKKISSLAYRPDGARLAAADFDGNAALYNPVTGEQITALPPEGAFKVAYSPDGRWLAGTGRQRISLWDQKNNAPVIELGSRSGAIGFSADSRELVSADQDHILRVWNLESKEIRTVMQGHTAELFAAVFHPSGKRIVAAGRDATIKVWDPASGAEVARLLGHANYVWSLAFSPDGTTLVSGSGDGTVRLWETRPLAARHQAQRDAESLRPEAELLVEKMFSAGKKPDDVFSAIQADGSLSAALRAAARRALLQRQTMSPGKVKS
jgi:eukaryotic-like serine/threonine-protein kinase